MIAKVPKLWPSDAVILVCSSAETANVRAMDSVHAAHCRDCGCDVVYSGSSMNAAQAADVTFGRPVDFLCVECCVTYDASSIERLIDHRKKEGAKP